MISSKLRGVSTARLSRNDSDCPSLSRYPSNNNALRDERYINVIYIMTVGISAGAGVKGNECSRFESRIQPHCAIKCHYLRVTGLPGLKIVHFSKHAAYKC